MLSLGASDRFIGRLFGKPYQTIQQINNGRNWEDIEPADKVSSEYQRQLDEHLKSGGRRAVGKRLSNQEVAEIKALCNRGMTQKFAASIYGVSDAMIGLIMRGLSRETVEPLC